MVITAKYNSSSHKLTPSNLYKRCTTSELVGFVHGRKDELGDLRDDIVSILKKSDKRLRFRFLDLPLEIRTIIYGLLVEEDDIVKRISLPNVLFTCRQIYAEAAETYFSVNAFLFRIETPPIYLRGSWKYYHMHKPAAISAMRHLTFVVGDWHYPYASDPDRYVWTSFAIRFDTSYHTPSRKSRFIGYTIHSGLALDDLEGEEWIPSDRAQHALDYVREKISPVLDEIVSPEGAGSLSLNAIKQIAEPFRATGMELVFGPD